MAQVVVVVQERTYFVGVAAAVALAEDRERQDYAVAIGFI